MRSLLLALMAAALITTPAMAGRNENGALIVHTNDAYNYSSVNVCTTTSGNVTNCETAVTMATKETGQVVWLLGAWSPAASPCVTVVYFGIDYDDTTLDPGGAYKFCGPAGTLDVPDGDWPYTGRGNSVAFGSPVCGNLFRFYVFKIDGGVTGSYFGTAINPTGGYAGFVDDSPNPVLDYCYNFGTIRWNQAGSNQCPQPTGACCFADGHCTVLTQAACQGQGGTYQGDGTPCNPNPCAPPTGACCFPGGSCWIVTQAECQSAGGAYQGDGTPCNPNPCPQPEGACCLADGSCVVTTAADCDFQGGQYHGNGTTCDPNPCQQPPEACCLADGTCTFVFPDQCTGTPQGPGTDCTPNPCPSQEACCFEDGTCLDFDPDDCVQQGGSPQGPGTTCVGSACPQAPEACCLPDGTCMYAPPANCAGIPQGPGTDCSPNPCPPPRGACCYPDGSCIFQTQAECQGNYLGDFRTCNPNPCPQPTGACCFADGSCVVTTAADCDSQGGQYYGNGTDCTPNLCPQPQGACCFPNGSCQLLSHNFCQAQGGSYQGDGTSCSPNPCAGPGGENANGAMIVHTDNFYSYSAATACTDTAGDPGTCENANTMATREAGQVVWCLAAFLPGADPCVTVVYFGIDYDDQNLDPGIAYQFCGPPGTIEIPDGDWPYGGRGNSVAFGYPVCHDILFPFYVFQIDGGVAGTSFFCTAVNPTGGYAAFVNNGDPPQIDYCYNFGCIRWGEPGGNPCPIAPPPRGACCYPDGHCEFVEETQCTGQYMGDDVPCNPNPCPQPPQACCLPDGTCTVVPPAQCAGTPQGPGTDCTPNPCPPPPPPRGACCFPNGSCQMLDHTTCQAQGGTYLGDGTSCSPNPCAGPGGQNANGAMIVHTDNFYSYSAATVCTDTAGDPGTCENANTMATREAGQVVWCLAAFLPSMDPCVTVVYFGIDYDDQHLDPGVAYKFCGPAGTIEVPDPGWPQGGRGNSVAFGYPVCHDTLFPFYVFKIDGGVAGQSFFCTAINPTGGYAGFVNNDNPPHLDYCYNFGCIRWGESGQNQCPQAPIERGACCYPDGTCVFGPPAECQGQYMGADVPCNPNPCPQPGACCFPDNHCEITMPQDCPGSWFGGPCDPDPCTIVEQFGACCFPDGHCEFLESAQCAGGLFLPDVPCEPDPCPPPVYGACCYPDGSCVYTFQADCQTGIFMPDVLCDPNPCPPPPPPRGACCYPDQTCQVETQAECQQHGGTYQGDGSDCTPNPCDEPCRPSGQPGSGSGAEGTAGTTRPVPLSPRNGPVKLIERNRDLCWSEPPDLNDTKISSEIICQYYLISEVANDFIIPTGTVVSRAIGYGGLYTWAGEPNLTSFNLIWYTDAGCYPGDLYATHYGAVPDQTFIGYDGYGYPTYKLESWVNVYVDGGTLYWFALQATDHVFPPQWGRQGTGGIVTNCDTMFKSAFFGYPNWTPAGDLIGMPYDAAQEFECGGATPVRDTTWGKIKVLFR